MSDHQQGPQGPGPSPPDGGCSSPESEQQLVPRTRSGNSSGKRSSEPRRSSPTVPDAQACLSALGQLPGLIAMGLVTTAQANSMRGIYSTILQQHHRERAGREQPQLDNAQLLELLRTRPEMLSMLEPLLTDEQIASVMQQVREEQDGET